MELGAVLPWLPWFRAWATHLPLVFGMCMWGGSLIFCKAAHWYRRLRPWRPPPPAAAAVVHRKIRA